jgi:hypothetical protein
VMDYAIYRFDMKGHQDLINKNIELNKQCGELKELTELKERVLYLEEELKKKVIKDEEYLKKKEYRNALQIKSLEIDLMTERQKRRYWHVTQDKDYHNISGFDVRYLDDEVLNKYVKELDKKNIK